MEPTSTATVTRRLCKSRRNRMIDGICGGIAEYFDVDPTIVRILWVLITLLGGSGIILYIVAMVIMPVNPDHIGPGQPPPPAGRQTDKRRFWGLLLILVGALILFTNFGWLAAFRWWHMSWDVMFPIALILLGGWLMYVHANRTRAENAGGADTAQGGAPVTSVRKELRRSVSERKLFGVCAGLAKYLEVDPTIVRVLYVLLVLASFGWGLLLYIILVILVPEEKPSTTIA